MGHTNLGIEIQKKGLSLDRFWGGMKMTNYLQHLPPRPLGSGDDVQDVGTWKFVKITKIDNTVY